MIHKFYSSRGKKLNEPLFESIPVDSRASFHVFQLNERSLPFAWHYHPEIEIDLYVQGEGLRFVGDSVENFQAGDLCIIGSNLPHSWTARPLRGKRQRSIFIQFLPDCLGPGYFAKPELRRIGRLLERSGIGLKFHGKTQRTVAEKIVALKKLPHGDWRRVAGLLSILGTLAESKECKTLASPTYLPSHNLEADQRLNRVLHFINADPDIIPSQGAAARKAGMSPPAFSRFFKRCAGKNYVQFCNEIRINRACQFLPDPSRSILDVAMHAGFNNLSNFNEQFRRIKGMTPRDYRRQWEALYP